MKTKEVFYQDTSWWFKVFCEDFKDFHPRWNILFKGKHKKRTMERFRL